MFNIGDFVGIKNTNLNGYIVDKKIKNNSNIYNVNINNKQTFISEDKLIAMKPDFDQGPNIVKINYDRELGSKEFSSELIIRHQTMEEVIFNLDLFVKEALFNEIKVIKIVHGKQGGILRKAVSDYLKASPHIDAYRLGNYFEGGYGVTIATLKISKY